jgi:hypothetical protein
MHTQREFCQGVQHLQGDSIVIAKDNQPTVREDLEAFFEDAEADRGTWQSDEQIEKGHERLEWPQIWTSPDMNDWFARQWRDVAQVFRLESTVRKLKTGEMHHEVVYRFSSLSQQRAPAARMNTFVRRHWAGENELHWPRDVTLGEDACQSRTGKVPQMLATLNNIVLALMEMLAVPNVVAQMRTFAAFPEQALQLVLRGENEKPCNISAHALAENELVCIIRTKIHIVACPRSRKGGEQSSWQRQPKPFDNRLAISLLIPPGLLQPKTSSTR